MDIYENVQMKSTGLNLIGRTKYQQHNVWKTKTENIVIRRQYFLNSTVQHMDVRKDNVTDYRIYTRCVKKCRYPRYHICRRSCICTKVIGHVGMCVGTCPPPRYILLICCATACQLTFSNPWLPPSSCCLCLLNNNSSMTHLIWHTEQILNRDFSVWMGRFPKSLIVPLIVNSLYPTGRVPLNVAVNVSEPSCQCWIIH